METATQAMWTAILVVLVTVLVRVSRWLQLRKRRLAADAMRAKMLPQMLERYDADRDGQLNATEYTLLLHDIGENVHMTPDKWELERGLLGAPATGVRVEHLEVLYSKYRLGLFEAEFTQCARLPRWPGAGGWVSDHYTLGKILGAGGEGRVYVATATAPAESDASKVAVKVLDKEAMGIRFQAPRQRRQSIRDCFREIEVLKILGQHPHIVQMQSAYQCVEEIAIVLSLATGEEVSTVLARRGHFTEPDARTVVRQVCSALAHCHALRVVHRDIKPANIMFADPSHRAIMLVDFGCAGMPALAPSAARDQTPPTTLESGGSGGQTGRRREPAVVLHKVIGTTMYMAPEFFVPRQELLDAQQPQGVSMQSSTSAELAFANVVELELEEMEAAARGIEYDEGVDIWALGVVAFELVFGTWPMDAQWETELEAKIAKGVWDFPSDDTVPSVSEAARAMIRGAMTVDRRERVCANELLRHPWLQEDQAAGEHSKSLIDETAEDAMPKPVAAVCLEKEDERPAEGMPPSHSALVTVGTNSCGSRPRQSDRSPGMADAAAVAEGTPPTTETSQTTAGRPAQIPTSVRDNSGLSLVAAVPEGRPPPSRDGIRTGRDRAACPAEPQQDLSSSDDEEFEDCRAAEL